MIVLDVLADVRNLVVTENDKNGAVNGAVNEETAKLSEKAQRLLQYLKEYQRVTTAETCKVLGVARRTAQRYIYELLSRNFIRRVGSDKTGYYELNEYNRF